METKIKLTKERLLWKRIYANITASFLTLRYKMRGFVTYQPLPTQLCDPLRIKSHILRCLMLCPVGFVSKVVTKFTSTALTSSRGSVATLKD
jgi:hypothetical protein